MSGIFGISNLPVSTVHTTITPNGPIEMPKYIPSVIREYNPDEFISTNALNAKRHSFLKAFLLKASKAARHV